MVKTFPFWWHLAWRALAGLGIGLLVGRLFSEPPEQAHEAPPPVGGELLAAGAGTELYGRVEALLERERLFATGDRAALSSAYRDARESAAFEGRTDLGELVETAGAWARRDPGGMSSALVRDGRTVAGGLAVLGKFGGQEAFAAHLSVVGPEAAFEVAGRFGSRAARDFFRWEVVGAVFRSDPKDVAGFIEAHSAELAERWTGDGILHDLDSKIAGLNLEFPEFAALAPQLPPSPTRTRILQSLVEWESGFDRRTWWESLSPGLKIEALPGFLRSGESAVEGWGPERWESLVTELAPGAPRHQLEAFVMVLFPAWAEADPHAALSWIDSAPECEPRLPALGEAVLALARRDVDLAKSSFDRLGSLTGRATAAAAIASVMAEASPESAWAWVRPFPVGYVRDEAGEALEVVPPPPSIEIDRGDGSDPGGPAND